MLVPSLMLYCCTSFIPFKTIHAYASLVVTLFLLSHFFVIKAPWTRKRTENEKETPTDRVGGTGTADSFYCTALHFIPLAEPSRWISASCWPSLPAVPSNSMKVEQKCNAMIMKPMKPGAAVWYRISTYNKYEGISGNWYGCAPVRAERLQLSWVRCW